MKTAIILLRNIFTAIAAMLLIAGCSGSTTTSSGETGSITAKLVWSDAKTAAKTLALAPSGVTTVRFIISGNGMTTVQQDFPAADGSGTVSSVLAGSGRTFAAQGLNASGTLTHQGVISNITVQINQNTDVGTVLMLPVNPPTVPADLSAIAVSSSQINLSWTDVTDETGYKIERKAGAGGTYAQIGTAGGNSTSFTDTDVAPSTRYFYRIYATNNIGDSDPSIEANADTFAVAGSTITDSITGMVLVKVTGGTFTMGDIFGDGYSDQKPTHQVTVGDFYIGKYEVTQEEWQTVMGSNPSFFSACGANCPVEQISWNDIQNFISNLNQRGGKNYRLPTEAEWEYAARSGGKSEKYSGGSDVDVFAWYGNNSGYTTHPVGNKQPNGLGLFDMSGNVWEWVNDWYGSYNSDTQVNPAGPATGTYRVFRGGSWYNDPMGERNSNRNSGFSSDWSGVIGFRLAISVP